jgi:ZIP family zinc transporter
MDLSAESFLIAFTLTLIAGLSTGIGSAMAFFAKKTNTNFLSVALGFSAGVMIYISFVELYAQGAENFIAHYGDRLGSFYNFLFFIGGMLFIAIIDRLVPSSENPHEVHHIEEMKEVDKKKRLMRTGLFSALVIAIHNFPEGVATFAAGLSDMSIAIPITVAIAIHNIPEGIAVSIPIYYATSSRKKAFWYSFSSGLAEPVGGVIGYLILRNYLNDLTLGATFSVIAGIMVFISLDELLPTAKEYGKPHAAIYGLIAGIILMAISLVLFK